jgi:hypothetical protein
MPHNYRGRLASHSRSSTPDTINYRLVNEDDEETTPLLRHDGVAGITSAISFAAHRGLVGSPESRRRADLTLRQHANPAVIHQTFKAQEERLQEVFKAMAAPNAVVFETEKILYMRFDPVSTQMQTCSNLLTRKFKRYGNSHPDLRLLVKDIAKMSKNGGLTKDNVLDLCENHLSGPLLSAFESLRLMESEPEQLFSYFLNQYSSVETGQQRLGKFYAYRFSGKRSSMEHEVNVLFDLALVAFLGETTADVASQVRNHVLVLMPEAARSAFLNAETRYKAIVGLYPNSSEQEGLRLLTRLKFDIVDAMG